VERRRNRLKCGSRKIYNYALFTSRIMAWLDFEWVVLSWKMQCTAGLRLGLKMLVRIVGFQNVRPSLCTVRELPQPLQSIDVQACSGIVIVNTVKLQSSWAVVDLFRPEFV
jgi:hypothetical protein